MPALFDLHNQVQRALRNLDFEVDFIEDYVNPYSPLYRETRMRPIKQLYFNLCNPNKKRFIKNGVLSSHKKYDYFLCVDGFSFDKSLINHLKTVNPNLKAILYLYDSVNFFDFTGYFSSFDKIYTFDYVDAKRFGLNMLPLFWDLAYPVNQQEKYSYDLFFVGKLHSDRYELLNQINQEARCKGLHTYIKLYVDIKPLSSWSFRLKYRIFSTLSKSYKQKMQLYYLLGRKKIESEILTYTSISKHELDQKMAESLCVVDIELPCQSGLSNRLIQALAMNKKLLTTNRTIEKTDLYNSSMIDFIEREHPNISIDFLKKSNEKISGIEHLRIDNWLKTLLDM